MKKSLFIIILIFLMIAIAYAADTELQDLTVISSPAATDVLYIVDDPNGTPASRKITIGNIFAVGAHIDGSGNIIDFALSADADAGDIDIKSLDKLEFFDAAVYIDGGADGVLEIEADTGVDFGTAGVRFLDDGDGAITLLGLGDGSDENWIINLDDTANEITFSSGTGVTHIMLSSLDLKIGGDDLFMNTNTDKCLLVADGTNFNPVVSSGDVIIDNTGAATVQNNSVDGTDIAIGSDAEGDVMYYNGTDWTRLAKGTAGQVLEMNAGATAPEWDTDDTGGTTAWDDIANPDNGGLTTITFDNAELSLLTGDNDAAASFITIQNSDADHTGGNLYLLDLDYSADDGDPDADYIKCQDSGSVVFSVQQDGEVATDGGITAGGTIEGATLTEGGVAVHNNDEMDSSSELIAIVDDETGTGALVFATDPVFVTNIYFEGASNDANETKVTFADPTADRTITFGDQTINFTNGFDPDGAVDIDYGSADITDHTFTTNDTVVIIDEGITVQTGDNITLGATQWNSGDEINGDIISDDSIDDDSIDFTQGVGLTGGDMYLGDCGDITSSGTITATVGFDIVGAADIDYGSADVTDHTFTTDGTGDAEFVVPNDSIGPAEVDSTTGAWDFGSVTTLEIPNVAAGDLTLGTEGQVALKSHEDAVAYHSGSSGEISGEVLVSHLQMLSVSFDPGSWYDSDAELFLFEVHADKFPNGIIIDEWKVSCNVDPDVEMNADLRYADAWIGLANAADIDEIDTTNGTSSEDTDANINSGNAVAAGKVIYIGFDGDPEGTAVQMNFMMIFHAEED